MLRLRFPESQIAYWAARFPVTDDGPVFRLAAGARERGFLHKSEFLVLGDWKTPRSRPLRKRNSERLVREATRLALAARAEELKIGILRTLSGVDWPTASVILHFCDPGLYPILDVRALWSAGCNRPLPPFSFALWWNYTRLTRGLARRNRCSMRQVDRALWQYSKERQRT